MSPGACRLPAWPNLDWPGTELLGAEGLIKRLVSGPNTKNNGPRSIFIEKMARFLLFRREWRPHCAHISASVTLSARVGPRDEIRAQWAPGATKKRKRGQISKFGSQLGPKLERSSLILGSRALVLGQLCAKLR